MTAEPGPRIAPIPPEGWPESMRAALAALRPPTVRHEPAPRGPDDPKGLNLLGTVAHHPDAARAYHGLCGHVLFGTTLSERQRELLVLRVAARRDARYEWAQHVILGRAVGLGDDEIDAVGRGVEGGWDPVDAALLRAVDELIDDARIADETWTALSGVLDPRQLIDVVLTVGAYDVLAMLLRTFEVQLDDDLCG